MRAVVCHVICWVLFLAKPSEPSYVPKRKRHRLRRLAQQFCQLLKSWLKKITPQTITRIIAAMWSTIMAKVHSLQLKRRMYCSRRTRIKMAMKHSVKLRTPRFRHRLFVMSTLILASAQQEDGPAPIQPFDTDSVEFGVDNRCSACISDMKEHFVGDLVPSKRIIKGFGGTRVADISIGTMRIRIEDDNGQIETFDIPNSYYVPHAGQRLLSPQHWCKAMKKSQRPAQGVPASQTFHNRVVLNWNKGSSQRTIFLDPRTNVANFHIAPGFNRYALYCQEAKIETQQDDHNPLVIESSAVISDDEGADPFPADATEEPDFHVAAPKQTSFNLDGPVDVTRQQRPVLVEDEEDRGLQDNVSAEFLRWHHRFNHCSPKRLQLLARRGVIPRRLARCPIPVCSACLYGKATRRPWRTKPASVNDERHIPTKPGEVVSVDQMVSPTPGLIAQMSGFLTKQRYGYATVFVDHATDFTYCYFQKSDSAEETVEAKEAFERTAAQHGVKILHYHADNGVFASKAWKSHCLIKHQGLTFAGVGAHHQNGKAENKIRQLQSQSRTMLIHANRRWPEAITANLWPYAVRMACESSNVVPSLGFKDHRTPLEAFGKGHVTTNAKHWQPFGCPVYVLDAKLQTAGAIFNKWRDRSKVGIYLGPSPQHARTVALVLSLSTGHVSPQFHVSFDPSFQTVKKSFGGQPLNIEWLKKAGFRQQPAQATQPESPEQSGVQRELPPAPIGAQPPMPPEEALPNAADQQDQGIPSGDHTGPGIEPEGVPPEPEPEPPPAGDSLPQLRTRPARVRRKPTRLIETMLTILACSCVTQPAAGEIFALSTLFPHALEPELSQPIAMAASNDPDTLYYHEAMAAPDREQFVKAMVDEFQGQLDLGVFEIVLRSTLPTGATVLPAVWSMKRKRKQATGEVYRHKSRLNIGGHKMIFGRDYEATFAPVATWASIRLLLSMVLRNKWHTRQVDYVMAYPQAPAIRDTYMELPKGISIPGCSPDTHVLHIKRNIYGGKDAGRVWYQYLRAKLESIGFRASIHDECVFYKGRAMYVLYTDDSILAGPDPKELDSILKEIESAGLKITSEGGIEDFLGVTITHKDDGTSHLEQASLIESILKDLNLSAENVATKDTPMASSKLLSRHPESPDFDGHFNYRRVIGKLLWLGKCSRPDIEYATHQCARFSADPKFEHGQAVKWIGRYLKGTSDKGLILKPNGSSLDLYVDADFAGNWDPSIAGGDHATAQSRHGFVLMFCGMPLMHASQLQQLICLSTTEAEYVGLSRAIQEITPVVRVLQEMQELGFDVPSSEARVHCRVFEDNSGALEIATNPKFRPRTKHINQRFHFF